VTDGRPPQIIRMGELDDAWIDQTKAALETS
jgi:hypothetical protein